MLLPGSKYYPLVSKPRKPIPCMLMLICESNMFTGNVCVVEYSSGCRCERESNWSNESVFHLALTLIHLLRTWNEFKKAKAVLLQAWSGPVRSRKLRFLDFMTTAQDGGKFVSPTHRPHFCYRRSRPQSRSAIRRIYVNEKFHWHHLGSKKRPSDL
jgi:hypothetical protein